MNKCLVWRCTHCTYDNEPEVKVCAACSRTRDHGCQGNGSGTADALKKQQKRIRYRNLEGAGCARRIDFKRSDSETSLSSAGSSSLGSQTSLSCSSSWICAKCFIENSLQHKACTSCRTERRSLSHFPHNLLNNRDMKHLHKEDYMGKKSCQLKPLPPLLSSSPSIWLCASCSQQNSVVLAHCVVCSAPQSASISFANTPCVKSYSRKNKNKGANLTAPQPSPLSQNSHKAAISKSNPEKAQEKSDPNGCEKQPSQQEVQNQNDVVAKDETSESYREIIKYFRKLRTNFVDDSFRPCNKSVYGDESPTPRDLGDPRNGCHGNQVTWLRPHEIDAGYPGVKWTVFRTPLPTDIVQGSLGDCWLLSSLSVLADRPSLIEKIFLNKCVSTEGVYEVRLCKDGQWTNVLVDDYFPCSPNKKLTFAQSDRKQLWVPIIEKAVAKLYGGYHNLKAGHCSEGLQLLTGAPIECLKMSDYAEDLELFWGMLLSYKEAGYPMGVCCMGEEEQAASLGLTTRHAYSLLNLHGVEHVRLIQLRNPWAKDTWTGPYNNKCPNWTKELRAELMVFEDSSEAVFWMELTDFVRYFTTLDVCHLHTGWNEWRRSGTLSVTSPQVTYISVCETSCLDISLIQSSRRGEGAANSVDLCVVVLRCGEGDNSPQTVVEYSGRSLLSNVTCSTLISPGTYMVLPLSFLCPELDTRYTLVCLADKNWCVWEDTGSPHLLADVLYKVTLAKGEHRDALQGCSVYQLNKKVAGLVMVVENRNPHRYFHISCDNHNTSNVVSTRGQITTADWIPPLSRMIIMILTQLDETCGFKIQSSYKFSLLQEGPGEEAPHAPPVQGFLHRVYPL
ncbi:hypothetical protein ACHWQZ_G004545 [Mnemiopsis leidyi]